MPQPSFDDVSAQTDDLVGYLETAKGEVRVEALRNSLAEAVWRTRNIAWGIVQLKQHYQK
jgi:hypothetical protein